MGSLRVFEIGIATLAAGDLFGYSVSRHQTGHLHWQAANYTGWLQVGVAVGIGTSVVYGVPDYLDWVSGWVELVQLGADPRL